MAERIEYVLKINSEGQLLVAASKKGLCIVAFLPLSRRKKYVQDFLQREIPLACFEKGGRKLESFAGKIAKFLKKPDARCAAGLEKLSLDLRGTDFQKKVWQVLRKIPFGATCCYADVARALGRPRSARAVARAIGANRLAIMVPCHRVVRADGACGGYRWGMDMKKRLLGKEGALGRDGLIQSRQQRNGVQDFLCGGRYQ